MASRLLWPEKTPTFFKPNFIDRFHVFHHSTGTLGIPKDNILTLEEAPKPEGSEAVELKSTNLEHLVLKAAKLMQQHGGHLPLGFFWKAGGKVMGLKLLRFFTFFFGDGRGKIDGGIGMYWVPCRPCLLIHELLEVGP